MYVIKEHLEKILSKYDPNKPHYIGGKMMSRLQIFFNGGGFYVLSRAAMKIFAEQLYHNQTACPFYFHEDVGMARCLASVGIYPTDPKDEKGRRFFNMGNLVNHYYHESRDLTNSISPDIVTLHLTSPEQMLFADLFYYNIQ
ncbi:hypothetical protein WR25_03482 [Diploscapter pachys]|uniref:Hexosyltransferase n=1 Tax=Diploscapter pachys TaxID=2018661 RepID=A0A2A2LLZ9_9BILA|nr:hypothetical protein WR25_03482 [Diploscapter pachys]